ncbi:MAG: phosphate acyltransferase, partial [Clostridia bacterium]|nr:phosphate acyltransferase [Clostridia bacterium]
MITIAVDAMGGDNAPRAICEGVLLALREMPDIAVTLCGPEADLRPLLAGSEDVAARLNVIDAPEVISMHESPTLAVRRKVNSSMVKAMLEVKEGRAQAFVSAGS